MNRFFVFTAFLLLGHCSFPSLVLAETADDYINIGLAQEKAGQDDQAIAGFEGLPGLLPIFASLPGSPS